MNSTSWLLSRNKFFYIFVLAFVFIGTAYWNKGFIASDEYWIGITRYIPAQNSHLNTLVKEDDVKSPVQILPMYLAAQLALNNGVVEPYKQYSFVVLMMGIYAAIVYALGILIYYRRRCIFSDRTYEIDAASTSRNLTFLLFSFYFASPFIFTRPMFESVAAPFLFLSAVYALIYDAEVKISDLLLSLLFFSIAFLLRPQVCLTALALVILPILKKRWRDFFIICGVGLLALILTGIPDLLLLGKFHGSLIKLANYNVAHGEEYGRQPAYYFPVLILALTLSPFFIKRYRSGFFVNHLIQHRVLVLYIVLFVFFHSLFPHKFERFIIPVLPLLMLFMVPLIENLYENRKSLMFRWIALLFLNISLFFVATFSPAQKNIIDVSLYINEHKNLKRIYVIDGAIDWIPEAFMSRDPVEIIAVENSKMDMISNASCETAIVTRASDESKFSPPASFKMLEKFDVNLIEKLAHKLNPKNNSRRVPLMLWGCE